MTISAQGDPETLDQIIKNVNKLIDVIHASEHDPMHAIEQELALIKIRVTPAVKAVIIKHSKKYHVKIIDTQEDRLILAQSGTSMELDGFEALMKKYGIEEYVRSGKVLMAIGKEKT
jgi:acetolactate synthase-1/3 small subunit